MQASDLAVQIEAMQRRIALLQQASSTGTAQQTLVEEAFEQLQNGLEELRAAEESLLQQNIELLAAQEALIAERQRYQGLFDFAPNGYLVTTASGIIKEANQAACRLLNMTHDALINATLAFFVVEEQRQQFHHTLAELRSVERLEDQEFRFQAHKSTLFTGAFTAMSVRDGAGHITAIRWSIRDVTERRQAEDRIRRLNNELELRVAERTSELEAANRLKDQLFHREQQARLFAEDALKIRDAFLTTASHELKTPLTSLIGYAYLLQHALARNDTSQTTAALKVIMGQSQRLNQLIETMIDLAQVQQDQISLLRQQRDLVALAQQVVAEFSPTLTRHSMHLLVEEQPLMVNADAERLQQVLLTLFQNAVKYSPHGGAIRVQLLRQDGDACIRVCDQGIGVPESAQSAIFERFYRADNFNQLRISGFGVGLYIARHIIELHGGRISVQNNQDAGSTFEIQLPLLQ
jgi:PAS domain S-box-containing protein